MAERLGAGSHRRPQRRQLGRPVKRPPAHHRGHPRSGALSTPMHRQRSCEAQAGSGAAGTSHADGPGPDQRLLRWLYRQAPEVWEIGDAQVRRQDVCLTREATREIRLRMAAERLRTHDHRHRDERHAARRRGGVQPMRQPPRKRRPLRRMRAHLQHRERQRATVLPPARGRTAESVNHGGAHARAALAKAQRAKPPEQGAVGRYLRLPPSGRHAFRAPVAFRVLSTLQWRSSGAPVGVEYKRPHRVDRGRLGRQEAR